MAGENIYLTVDIEIVDQQEMEVLLEAVQKGTKGDSAYIYIRYASHMPTQDSDMKTTPDAWMGIYGGTSGTAPTSYTSYDWYKIKGDPGEYSDLIDDTAGAGDYDLTWSADKLVSEFAEKADASDIGQANGIAELDSTGKVPSSQLPSYVDDVIEGYYYNDKFYEDSAHTTEITAEDGKIYVDLSTNKTYRWSGSTYVAISSDLTLGETSSTAYRGDRGKTAYDHATDPDRVTTVKSEGLYKVAVTGEGHVKSATAVEKSDITSLGIPAQDTTYSDMVGATSQQAGQSGLVPAPASGDDTKYLKGDGTWGAVVIPTVYGNTIEMSSSDSTKVSEAIAEKVDKVTSPTSGNFAGLDSNGNITDSGSKASDFLTSHQDISGKADKVSSATSGNFAGLDSNGNLTDSGSKASDFLTSHQDITGKADKVTGATNGNFASLDSNGNLTDSGHKHSEYLTGKRLSAQTLTAGSTTLTFTDSVITTNSTIVPYASVWGISPSAVAVTTGQVVLTFDALQDSISVYIEVW